MISVSQEYINATKQYTRTTSTRYVFTLTDGTSFELSENNTKGNCKISNQCVTGSGFELGSVCVGEMSLTINDTGYTDLTGATVQVFNSLYTSNGWEEICMGIYIVTKATRKNSLISLNCSDNVMKLDKSFYDSDIYENRVNTLASILSNRDRLHSHFYNICEICDTDTIQTPEELSAFEPYETDCNVYSIDKDTINASARDFLSYIATLYGAFAYADSLGYIRIKRFGTSVVYTVDYSQIISNGYNESNFQMRLYGSYYQDDSNAWCKVWYPAYENLSNSIIVDTSQNLFLQQYYQDNGLPMHDVGNICLAVGSISYIPFDITIIGNSALEIGDCINIQRKDGSYFTSVITHISWTSKGSQNLKCVGEDTRTLGSDIRNQTARLSETTQKKINDIKGIDLTQEDFNNLDITDLKEGKTYYVY